MTKDEALRLALKTLEMFCEHGAILRPIETRDAIKAALEAKDEPVAWAKFSAKGNIIDLLNEPDDDYTPLYTTPPQRTWSGLTDDELFDCWESAMNGNVYTKIRVYSAIEAKLKELNT